MDKAKVITKNKFDFETLFWTNTPYFSKINLQKLDKLVDVYLIKYSVGARILHGLLIEPKDKDKKYPVIIYSRGGNNVDPINSDMGTKFETLGGLSLFDFVYKSNYIIYTSQLSGYGENSGKDEFGGEDINDLIGLKDLIDENPICDSSRVGMLGYSRGGMMSYLVLQKTDWLKTIAVVGGVSNMERNGNERSEMQDLVFTPAFGGSSEEKEKRSILENISKLPLDSNILILHGKEDDRVNYNDSVELDKKLEETKINHKFILYENGSHSLKENRMERDKEILEWFEKYL